MWREKVRTGTEEVNAGVEAVGIAAYFNRDTRRRIENAAAKYRVADAVAELRIPNAQAVRPRAVAVVHTNRVYWSVVYVGERLEIVGDNAFDGFVLFVRETVKNLQVRACLPVQTADEHGVVEWRIERGA